MVKLNWLYRRFNNGCRHAIKGDFEHGDFVVQELMYHHFNKPGRVMIINMTAIERSCSNGRFGFKPYNLLELILDIIV